MRHAYCKAFAATGAAALLLTACNFGGDTDDGGPGDAAVSQHRVYAEMRTWDACDVLDGLQPITEYMDIKGYGSLTSEGGEPGNQEIGNTFDPDAIGCGSLISLGESEGFASGGQLNVSIVPTENEDTAATSYSERSSGAESAGSGGQEFTETAIGAPWDDGALYSWAGDADAPHLELIARDGQWLLHITLEHDKDLGLQNTGTPSYAFTDEALHQWLVDAYLPEVHQAVNDRIAEAR